MSSKRLVMSGFVIAGGFSLCAATAPGQICEPAPDGFSCVPLVCSDIPEDQCLATVLRVDWATGAIKTVACDCMNFNQCHIEFGDALPHAVGYCPEGHACEVFGWDTSNDGKNDHFAAECVPIGIGACCIDIDDGPIGLDTCVETDEEACEGWYFVPVNTGCSEIEACCLSFCGETFCADLNRHCCILTGGVPLGPGTTCADDPSHNPCGEICGGIAWIPCKNPEEFCRLPTGHCCCDFMGICTPFPDCCPDVWEPVCGCDGETYPNECEADAVGVSINHYGTCEVPCTSNADCPNADLFCWLPAGYCGDAGVSGICIPGPDTCPDTWAPVCGCDGQTYGNACRAHAAGVSIRHSGECERVCGHSGPDPQCEPDEFCKYPVGTCGDLTVLGICTPIPDACEGPWDPVCGCDSVIYGNECEADLASMSILHWGECEPGSVGACCIRTPDGGLLCIETDEASCLAEGGTHIGIDTTCTVDPAELCASYFWACCMPDGDCFDTWADYCIAVGGFPVPGAPCALVDCGSPCMTDADCDDGNVCTIGLCVNGVCEFEFVPDGTVCDDGDPCTADDVCKAGACVGTPIPGCGPCMSNADCPAADLFCLFPPETCGEAGIPGMCVPRPTACLDVWDPVCGCDGQTYSNECDAHAAGVSIRDHGECERICGGFAGYPCHDDEFCKFPEGVCSDAVDRTGVCTPIPPGPCPPVWDPVCGCDGRTYGSECESDAASVSVLHRGECDGAIGPDLIVHDIQSVINYGAEGDISAFSIGTEACNVGDERVSWIAHTNEHPVIGQNMYRLKEGRFEQIGMSWLIHGFWAVSGTACGPCEDPANGSELGVGCSTSHSAYFNGLQSNMGPRSDVNAHTGYFPYPPTSSDPQSEPYKLTDRRLQAHNVDLDPALNPEASYFVEGHYVAADEAAAGNGNDNISYRQVMISGPHNSGALYQVVVIGAVRSQQPAVWAWRDHDPTVFETEVQIPGEGLLILAAKAIELDNGMWRYEYALQNVNSHRSCGSFRIPLPPQNVIGAIDFHDVDYHSGEPFDGTDWEITIEGGGIIWGTANYEIDPTANALRWGTLYNFGFQVNAPPQLVEATIGLFRPGFPSAVQAQTLGPSGGPGEECVPTDDGTGCVPYPCSPALEEMCMSTALHLDPDGVIRVVACGCLDWMACRIELQNGVPTAMGGCFTDHSCEMVTSDTDGDGIADHFTAECVPAEIGACCQDITDGPIPYESCSDSTQEACEWLFHPETSCEEVEACCLGSSLCADLNPFCCDDSHGVPQGRGRSCADVVCESCGGPDDILCDNNTEFCKYPVGTCGDPRWPGICMPIRDNGCPEIYAPVCGCDGITYVNECESDTAGVSILHRGACEQLFCVANTDCASASQFCKFPVGTCGAAPGVPGVCTPIPEICPPLGDPVCGCDSVTYANECFADMAAVSIDHYAACDGPSCAAERVLSAPALSYCPGVPKDVPIQLNPRLGATAYGLEDSPPAGWEVTFISHEGTFDTANGKVKWGPFFFGPDFPRSVSYTVVPPNDASSVVCFEGTISIDGLNELICGDACIDSYCCPFAEADLPQPQCPPCPFGDCTSCANSACRDGRISLCELTGYTCAWKNGCNDDLAGVTRVAYIWRNGECYCWNESADNWFPTHCPPPSSGCCEGAAAGASIGSGSVSSSTSGSALAQFHIETRGRRGKGVIRELEVPITVEAPEGASSMALEFEVPQGWEIISISDEGQWDDIYHKVKWGPFTDVLSRPVTFRIRRLPSPSRLGSYATKARVPLRGLTGTVSFDGVNSPITVR